MCARRGRGTVAIRSEQPPLRLLRPGLGGPARRPPARIGPFRLFSGGFRPVRSIPPLCWQLPTVQARRKPLPCLRFRPWFTYFEMWTPISFCPSPYPARFFSDRIQAVLPLAEPTEPQLNQCYENITSSFSYEKRAKSLIIYMCMYVYTIIYIYIWFTWFTWFTYFFMLTRERNKKFTQNPPKKTFSLYTPIN